MPNKRVSLENIPHFRFTSLLSDDTLSLLKSQVGRMMRDQMDEPLIERFLNWERQQNEIFLYATYSSLEFDLPLDFDIFFWDGSDDYKYYQVHVPFSVINGWAPIAKVAQGHKHVCLLQFQGEVPGFIWNLPEVNHSVAKTSDLFLVSKANLQVEYKD